MGDGARSGFFKEEAAEFKIQNSKNCLGQIIPFLFCGSYATLVGVHPRHPPRAFPLGLRVPRCLCAGKQKSKRLKYQEMRRLEFARSSWGEEVSSPRVGLSACWRSLPSPSPLYVFQYCVWCVAFAFDFCIAIRVRHSSFSHGHPSGNARGGNTSCLPQPRRVRRGYPTRACTRESLPRKIQVPSGRFELPKSR